MGSRQAGRQSGGGPAHAPSREARYDNISFAHWPEDLHPLVGRAGGLGGTRRAKGGELLPLGVEKHWGAVLEPC